MTITRFPHGVSSWGMPLLGSGGHFTTGNVFFVTSNTSYGSNSNDGTTPESAFATLDYAIGKCTASKGDTIFVKEGHAETLTSTVQIDTAGITIIGLGNGDNRPTFTVNGVIPGFNVVADDVTISGIRFANSTSATATARLMRIAASDIRVLNCRFEHTGTTYKLYHCVVVISGDNILFKGCEWINSASTRTATHAQCAFLNIGGTDVHINESRFYDFTALKTERWRTCVEGGPVGTSLSVEDCTFISRGIATATRTAGASGTTSHGLATIYCRAISPSANTAVGSNYTPTYQYILNSYNVAAVNKQALLAASTSDLRMKRNVVYL